MKTVVCFLFLPSIFSGCEKRTSTTAKLDACALIQREEVGAIVGSPIKEVQSSVHAERSFRVSHCLYTAEEFSKSVSFSITQKDPDSSDTRTPKDFWTETFGGYTDEEKEHEADKKEPGHDKEEEESPPPKKIDGLGDEAYWMRSGLYVLRKDVFIRISVGGAGSDDSKLEKSRALAAMAVKRL